VDTAPLGDGFIGPAVGTRVGMKFKLGFVAGFAVGYWVGSTPANERRTKVESLWSGVRENPRVQRIADTVTTDAHRVTDAVEQRLVNTADGAARAIAGSDSGNGGGTSSASASKRTSRSTGS
jgi:hypothetical protein